MAKDANAGLGRSQEGLCRLNNLDRFPASAGIAYPSGANLFFLMFSGCILAQIRSNTANMTQGEEPKNTGVCLAMHLRQWSKLRDCNKSKR